jgi:D-alanyl-lipoteichoic acid acyltransferase DltB (MBOAT superfamily)
VLFPTVEFAIYFPVVLALSWALMPHLQWWKIFVVAASYLFYGSANWKFCFLLGGITLGNHLFARLIAATDDARRRKQLVATAVALNLGTLGVFKYYAFFVEDVDRVLDSTGLGMPLPLLTVALPIGISFFTFQAITYVVDTYRGQVDPVPLLDVAVYLSFFSHLVAGPIVRASEFLPQIDRPRDPNNVAVGAGLFLIAVGLIKKVAIADYLAREVVDPVFAVPETFSAPDVIFGAYAYAGQIYCDFSGYTDMAIGLALLMGIVFPQNFNRPYRSRSFGEFWRRWHMTLSRFLRDYLYIPLGGNRGSRLFTARNLMLTMLLGGLWHGAAWGFVLWGGIHGTALVVEHQFRGRELGLPGWLKWFVTFHIVVLAWIVFRAPDLDVAGELLSQLGEWDSATVVTWTTALVVAATIGLQLLPERETGELRLRVEALHPAAMGAALAVVVALVAATVPTQGVPPFIYFAF